MIARFSTIGLSIKQYILELSNRCPELKYVYCEANDNYQSSIERYRSRRETQHKSPKPLPLMSYSRTVLNRSDQLRTQKGRQSFIDTINNVCVRGVYGVYDINFTIFSTDLYQIENYEVGYSSEDFMANVRFLDMKIPALQGTSVEEVRYSYFYNPLESKEFSIESNHYLALSGSFSVMGWFLSMEGEAKLIESIVANTHINPTLNFTDKIQVVNNLDKDIVETINITP